PHCCVPCLCGSASRRSGGPTCAPYPICPCPNRAVRVACELSGRDSPSGPYVQRDGTSSSSASVPTREGRPVRVSLCGSAEHRPTRAGGDLADDPALVALGPDRVEGGTGGLGRYNGQHAEPEVEDVLHFGVGDCARGLDLGEDARPLPGVTPDDGVAVVGEDAGKVPDDAAHSHGGGGGQGAGAAEVQHRGRVNDARTEELVGERVMGARPRRSVELAAVDIEQRASGERVPVATQAAAGEADDRVAGSHTGGKRPRPLHAAGGGADEGEILPPHDPPALPPLAPQEPAAPPAASPRAPA